MTAIPTIEQILQGILDARGYLVIATDGTFLSGHVFDGSINAWLFGELNHKVVVTSETDMDDHRRQLEMVPEWAGYYKGPHRKCAHYYRVVAE